jgi:excisionase family DNA binding protein
MQRTEEAPADFVKKFHRLAKTDRLRELREALGLTQADVARHLGVAPSQVSRWEAGDRRPRPDRIRALLEVLEVPLVLLVLLSLLLAQDLADRVLTVREAAALLHVSPGTYYAAAKRGEVPVVAIGRRLVVPGAALARLLAGASFAETRP